MFFISFIFSQCAGVLIFSIRVSQLQILHALLLLHIIHLFSRLRRGSYCDIVIRQTSFLRTYVEFYAKFYRASGLISDNRSTRLMQTHPSQRSTINLVFRPGSRIKSIVLRKLRDMLSATVQQSRAMNHLMR